MASREAICRSGKSILIDPNLLFGQGFDDNIFVSPEDLNIYVELTTSRKNRSIIDVIDNNVEYTSTDVGKLSVSFIDGAVNGYEKDADGKSIPKKSLTTSYTDLTTIFNKTADTEKFGMTSIDIDFNSSYAPLVHIEFVDVRGASLFNTGNPPKSEYASFFDLPYPIFQLKVKGYYGKTVKYCLHLTKWNARFNTKTGNFEISADFIGYTYAMLSDMLLGYLRAITYTPMGAAKFKEAKAEMNNPEELITIKELLDKIVEVNEAITKLSDTDKDVQELGKNKDIKSAIDNIEKLLLDGIKDITTPDSSSLDGYALLNSGDGLLGVRNSNDDVEQQRINSESVATWKDAMTNLVGELNNNISPESKFNVTNFAGNDAPLIYENFIYDDIVSGTTTTNMEQNNFRNSWNLTDEISYDNFMVDRMSTIVNNANIRRQNMTIYDFSKTIKTINEIKTISDEAERDVKEDVALKIKETFVEILGFEPTIGAIFRIFTVHAEIFLECLKEVSMKAESDTDGLRIEQLKGIQTSNGITPFDVHSSTSTPSGNLPAKIFPWPLFRKESKDVNKSGALEEAYLGDPDGGVKTPQNVPELVFVEELLEALIQVAKDDAAREERINNPNTIVDSWYPVNVLDTPLFGVVENPYKTKSIGDTNNPLDPLKLMLMRASTFLGLSNRDFYNVSEIQLMGILEANTCMEGTTKGPAKQAMMLTSDSDKVSADKIIKAFIDGNSGGRNVTYNYGPSKKPSNKPAPLIYDGGDWYYYNYVTDKFSYYPISFNGHFDASEFTNDVGEILTQSELLPTSRIKKDDGLLFTEPYSTGLTNSQNGAIFMKIFSNDEYGKQTKALFPQYVNQEGAYKQYLDIVKQNQTQYLASGDLYEESRDEEDLPKGFNIFGDETSKFFFNTVALVDITSLENSKIPLGEGRESPTGPNQNAPLPCLFYINQTTKFGATSLSLPPKDSSAELDNTHKGTHPNTNNVDYYDTRYNTSGGRPVIQTTYLKTSFQRHLQLGENRQLYNSNSMIPYVDFVVAYKDQIDRGLGIDNSRNVYSLFGSQLYFEQRRSSCPKAARALLFLHTLPWNQLYTDIVDILDKDGLTETSGFNASIFDNPEGSTISNLFDRKSAFLNVPYLWCAFIGGILWRYKEGDIIYEDDTNNPDPSGKVHSYTSPSGKFDPIIWGKKLDNLNKDSVIISNQAYVSEYNFSYGDSNIPINKFPKRHNYLTSWDALAPLELDTDGKHKEVEKILKNLPLQIRLEFKKKFFEFVNSQDWANIRGEYELHPKDWDIPSNASTIIYNEDGYNNGNWDSGTAKWKAAWNNASVLNFPSGTFGSWAPISSDPLEWYSKNGDLATGNFTEKNSGVIRGIKKSALNFVRPDAFKNYEFLQPIRQFNTPSSPVELSEVKNIQLRYNWDMGFRNNSTNQTLVRLFKSNVWIANATYKPWVSEIKPDLIQNQRKSFIGFPKINLQLYVEAFCNEWKKLVKLDIESKEEDEIKQRLFNTMDNNTIRLNIYRHCKAIYDKWIAGSGGNMVSACGSKTDDKSITSETSKVKRKAGSKIRLIDSFRFVNRGFNDLSDTYLINPKAVHEIMTNNFNQSFYDLISRLLSDNNFNFIALPAFIDFTSEEEMKVLFKPEIFNNDVISENVAGPTFVCVYVGQSSNKLDLGTDSFYTNDGFDFKCSDGQLESGDSKLPNDFTNEKKPHEHNVVAFAINYGQQNQNIFTDIKLDQQEFAETDESLQITDAIANTAGQSNQTQAGQNLWNVYQVRSYSAQVEAMGNAMIQPMMYFQLNNIPMFHGAYMIINAKHNIVPNYMTTTFKGVRTRYTDTPQVDAEALYMSMLGTIGDSEGFSTTIGGSGGSGGSAGQPRGSLAPIVRTIVENGGTNGNITDGTGSITVKSIPKINGINNFKLTNKTENNMLSEAVTPLVKMLEAWVTWMKQNGFNGDSDGNYAYITSIFRDYNKQVQVKKEYGSAAATPGTSPHGWGIAIDLQFLKKDGSIIRNEKNSISAFNVDKNPAIQWLYDNSYIYGFVLPYGLRNNTGLEEHWHFEYHGTAAKCLITEHPNVYGYVINTSKQQDSSVKNPKDKASKVAIYKDCKYQSPKSGDGTETSGKGSSLTEFNGNLLSFEQKKAQLGKI